MYLNSDQDILKITGNNTNQSYSPVSRLLFVRVTESCNASCFMCGFAGNQTPHLFTVELARKLIKELTESSIRHVRLTGGEPLLLEDIGRIVSVFKEARLAISIITNGMLLDKRCPDLVAAGLDQIIVSLDSPQPEIHDRLRKTKYLYQNALTGISHVREKSPSTIIRVNTVVGKHNLLSLPDMMVLLHKMGVRQWSLIPLKPINLRYTKGFEEQWFSVRDQLINQVLQLGRPHLLGNSLELFGSDQNDHRRIIEKASPKTPKTKCELVEWIRYLDLATQRVFPCNCVPHRGEQADRFSEAWTRNSWSKSALETSRDWLKHNGPTECTGCEPINAALGEGCIDLNEDLFGF